MNKKTNYIDECAILWLFNSTMIAGECSVMLFSWLFVLLGASLASECYSLMPREKKSKEEKRIEKQQQEALKLHQFQQIKLSSKRTSAK